MHQDPVLLLDRFPHRLDRSGRAGDRHVQERPFPQRRHELRTQGEIDGHDGTDGHGRQQDDDIAKAQGQAGKGVVRPDQKPIDRVLLFRGDRAADQDRHQEGADRDRQQGREKHRERLGPGQGLEEPPLLGLEAEHRQEGDGDDQEREEQRRPDIPGRLDDDLCAASTLLPCGHDLFRQGCLAGVTDEKPDGIDERHRRDGDASQPHHGSRQPNPPHRQIAQRYRQRRFGGRGENCLQAAGALGSLLGVFALDVRVSVLDHDDRSVDHDPDGDGDAAQTHDIGGQVDSPHGHESQQHGQRQGQHGDQGAAKVEQEHDDHQADDDRLFDELSAEGGHRRLDQWGAVVGNDQFHAFGQRGLDLVLNGPLDALENVVGVLAEADDDDASGNIAQAVVIHHASANVRADLHDTHVAHADGGAVRLGPQGDLLDVGHGLEVAAPAHHVLAAGELDYPPAIAPPPTRNRLSESIRKLAEVVTLSPASRPSMTWKRSPNLCGAILTSTGWNRPGDTTR